MKKKIIIIPAIFIVTITLFLMMSAKYFKPKQMPHSINNPLENRNNNIVSKDDMQLINTPKPEQIQNKSDHTLDKEIYFKVVNKNANAVLPLKIKTYDGMNQPMHPDIIYFENGFNGYKYWMAYTPYPFQIDRYENPCIATSNDGITWRTPVGLKNPIIQQPNDSKSGGHYSDTDIIYDNGKLIVYFVYNKFGIEGPSKFYRVTSSDGINWSKPELIYKCVSPISGYSPGIIKDNDNYKMWYISERNIMSLTTSSDGKSWKDPSKCNISIDNWTIWHVDVIKTDIGYEGLLCAKDNNVKNRALFYIKSADGINWTTSPLPIVYPSSKGWDSVEIYRSTMLKQNGLYRIWYSARGPEKVWQIGYTEGKTMETLQGYKE